MLMRDYRRGTVVTLVTLISEQAFISKQGGEFSRILINKQDLIGASRVEKRTFSPMK